jgi:hypothetical protein
MEQSRLMKAEGWGRAYIAGLLTLVALDGLVSGISEAGSDAPSASRDPGGLIVISILGMIAGIGALYVAVGAAKGRRRSRAVRRCAHRLPVWSWSRCGEEVSTRSGSGREALCDALPVDHVPPRLDVVRAAVLVVEVVGVLPHVDAEQWGLAV